MALLWKNILLARIVANNAVMLKVVRYHGDAFKNESENIKFLSKIFVKWQKKTEVKIYRSK